MEIPRLSKSQLSQSRVIARGAGIKEVNRLVAAYGGRVRGWSKKSSPRLSVGGRLAELHWYEHQGVGRFEQKLKWLE
jgi:hypothetical protein